MKKRIFALIMAMCLALSLLPASVFAENESDSDVVYGKYGTGTTWTQDNGTGTIEYKTGGGNTITLSKKATPLGDNTYRIDLEVKTTQTTTTTPPGAAATVLVIDTSGSMDYCSDCGQENSHADGCKYYSRNWWDNSIKNGQTRLAAAKEAAISFLDAYKGDTAGVGRYVSLVSFAGSASVKCDWQDVSTTSGYNAAKDAINNLSAKGGTNLDAGLSTATNQFTKSAVSGISKDSKNVIALTDGIPTYYGDNTSQHGSYGCPDTNAATAKSAAALKESASLYTVCFGAANDRCWTAGSAHTEDWWGNPVERHNTDGPLVGDFLRDSIATSATADTTYAYNAANSSELNAAFKAITTSITTGISSGTVTDPMGPNISVTAKPDNFVSADGKTYTWELANGVKSTDGSKTTYTYQLSYTVTLDTTGEGFDENAYYPANGKTTFTSGDETFEFPVPGVKGTIPSYQVKYAYTGTVPAGAPALPAEETHKLHTDVNVAAEPTLDGYVFSGWTTGDASVSGGQFKMPGKNVTLTGSWTLRSDLSYTVNYYWNGTTDKVAPSKTVDGQTFNATVTESPIGITGYTPVSADSTSLTIGTGTNEINFYYYQNVTLTANSDTVTYDGKEHSVSGFTGAPDGADFSAVTVGAKGTNVGTYDAKFAEDTVGTVDATAKYIVTEANDGKLTITPVGGIVVTITGNTGSRPYSGAEQSVTDYTVSTSNPLYTEADFTFTGTATAKGTDAGSYAMGLTPEQFENTNPNFENVTFIVTDGKLTITPRSVKLTSATDEKVYDGQPLTRPDVTVAGDGFVAGEVSDIRATGTVTNVSDGEQSNTIVYTTSAGFKPGNYSIEKDEGTLTITPVTDKVTVTVTGNNDSVVYDGNEHSVTGYTTAIDNQLYTVSDFTFTGEAIAKGTDADSYQMGLNKSQFANNSANFANVEFVVNDGALTVTPRPVTITAKSANFTYDGQTHTLPEAEITGLVGNDAITVTVAGEIRYPTATPVVNEVKGYEFTAGKASNYSVTTANGELTMSWPTAQKVVVTANTATKTYDGTPLTDGGYTVEFGGQTYHLAAGQPQELANGDVLTVQIEGSVTDVEPSPTANKIVSVSIMNGTTDVHHIYNVQRENGELQVTPMPLTVTAGSDSKIYDGTALTKNSYTSTDPAAGDTLASVTVTGSQTNAGSSENIASGAKLMRGDRDVTANYAIEYLPGTLTVTPVTDKVTVTITGYTDTVTYNGAERSVTGYETVISNPLYKAEDFTFSGEAIAKGIDADTYKMNLTAAQFENNSHNFTNVEFTVTDGWLKIDPMALTITADSGSKVYDGTALTKNSYTSTAPAAGDTLASVTVTGSQKDVGSSDNVARDAKLMRGDRDVTANYAITYEKGTLAVTPLTDKVTVTITGNTSTLTYNGAEQSVTGYKVESISNPLYTAADFAFSGTASVTGTDADTYAMGLTAAQFRNQSANITNVEFIVTDGSLQINPRSVKLTSTTDEKVYDGQPLTNGAVTVSGDGFAEGEGAAYNVTGSQTNAGSSDNTFTYTLNPGTKAKNYTVETEPGKLTVTPVTAEVTVTITGNKSTVTYNGAEQSVTGYKVESISNPLYTEENLAFSGEAIAKGTDSDTYKMNLTAAQFENNSKNFTNVQIIVTDGELTINPMALTITAGFDSKAYDGTPLTCGEFDSTTPAEGDTVASVTLTGSQTNVGSGDNVASDAKLVRGDRDVTANYAIEYVNGKLTVTKNESAKLTADAYRGVYDGAAHDAVVKTTITGAVEGDSWTYAYSLDGENYTAELPQVKNVGAYPVWVKATNDNYVDLVTVVTAEVTPATILVTADSHEWIIAVKDTCVSDPEPALTYQAESPVAGETPAFSGELSREPGAERGKTYQILQGDLALADGENFLASNYVLQFVPGELTVKARDITITKTVDVTKAFVGDKLTYTITVTNTGDVDLQDVAVVDEMLGIEQVIGELKAGESWTQQFTYTAQESDAGKTLVNTAVTGTKDEKTFDQVDSDGTEITQKPVPTGDQSMVGLWTATLLISAAGAAIILARKSRRSK